MNLTGKILIVDDDEMTLNFFDITLTKLGFEIIKSNDGLDALEKIKLHTPDIILLENKIPGLSGIEVTKKIRNSSEFKKINNIPIIMFSALIDPKDKVVGLETGVDDYITKPFNFSEVLARIRTILRHKELSNQILQRERRLAILESLNTNLIAFTRHIKKPLTTLHKEIKDINYSNEQQVKNIIKKFDENYQEMIAMLEALEEEVLEIEKKGRSMKKDEISLDELEKKINAHLKSIKDTTC